MFLFLSSRDILLHFPISVCLFLGSDSYLDYNSCQAPSYQDSAPLRLGACHNSHGYKQVSVGVGEGGKEGKGTEGRAIVVCVGMYILKKFLGLEMRHPLDEA
jgi:hypothetical protein